MRLSIRSFTPGASQGKIRRSLHLTFSPVPCRLYSGRRSRLRVVQTSPGLYLAISALLQSHVACSASMKYESLVTSLGILLLL